MPMTPMQDHTEKKSKVEAALADWLASGDERWVVIRLPTGENSCHIVELSQGHGAIRLTHCCGSTSRDAAIGAAIDGWTRKHGQHDAS